MANRLTEADKGTMHPRCKIPIRPSGNGVGFVQKEFRTRKFASHHRRRGSETTHGYHGGGATLLEKPLRIADRTSERAEKLQIVAPLQGNRGQGHHFHVRHATDRQLIDFFGRNQQRHIAATTHKLATDGHTRKQVTARSAAGDGYEGFLVHCISAAAMKTVSADSSSRITTSSVARRATLSSTPIQAIMAIRFDPP